MALNGRQKSRPRRRNDEKSQPEGKSADGKEKIQRISCFCAKKVVTLYA